MLCYRSAYMLAGITANLRTGCMRFSPTPDGGPSSATTLVERHRPREDKYEMGYCADIVSRLMSDYEVTLVNDNSEFRWYLPPFITSAN